MCYVGRNGQQMYVGVGQLLAEQEYSIVYWVTKEGWVTKVVGNVDHKLF